MAEISAGVPAAPSSSADAADAGGTVDDAEAIRPYRPAWIHALGDAIERIPGRPQQVIARSL
jgi:hypothetical protein